ncbi:MAG: hypothetical protein RL033_4958 [Pseudomonadota bacterium]|jgi:hypothetical protein
MAARPELIHRPSSRRAVWAAAALLCACQSKSSLSSNEGATPAEVAPDRLAPQERPTEAATAFGLSLPKGMRLTNQSHNSAYFLGQLDLATVVEHLKPHLEAQRVESHPGHTAFEQAKVVNDSSGRLLRVDISAEGLGTLVFVQDVTPPPAPRGVSESEMWRRAGRNPDGTPKDQNQQF